MRHTLNWMVRWFNPFGPQMLYFSSALSLYFPWDFCLYPGATSLQMSAVQFITPVTVLVVVIVTLLIIKRRYNGHQFCLYSFHNTALFPSLPFSSPSPPFSPPLSLSNIRRMWHGILTLILLIYPSLVYNCMSLLHCPTLPDNTTSQGSMVHADCYIMSHSVLISSHSPGLLMAQSNASVAGNTPS